MLRRNRLKEEIEVEIEAREHAIRRANYQGFADLERVDRIAAERKAKLEAEILAERKLVEEANERAIITA